MKRSINFNIKNIKNKIKSINLEGLNDKEYGELWIYGLL